MDFNIIIGGVREPVSLFVLVTGPFPDYVCCYSLPFMIMMMMMET